jgi:hypothetical protein
MKNNISISLFAALLITLGIMACTKAITNRSFSNGSTPVLNVSTKAIAPTPGDSLKSALMLTWTNPRYATDSATELYTIQIDSSGRNFSKAVSIAVSGALSDTLTAKQINTIALGFGFSYNVAYNLDFRLISSYANNNEAHTSNTITVSYTPYVIPPKVQPPSSKQLFLVGDATQGGWANPVPVPTQVFERVDSVDYAGVFNLLGGFHYLALPVNGDWTHKFATNEANPATTGGTFGFDASNNFAGPVTSGWYTIWFNFQTGIVSVAPYSGFVPDSLFIVGNATPGGWNNPVPDPGQALTQINSSQFSISLPLSAAGQFLLLPVNGDWTNKFATADGSETGTGGTFGYNASNNFGGPANAGTYTVQADFLTNKFTVTQ